MLALRRVSQFKKDFKRCVKRGFNVRKLYAVVDLLESGKKLDVKFRDHALLGDYKDCRECHIEPDWILIYMQKETEIVLIRTGTHADLFE